MISHSPTADRHVQLANILVERRALIDAAEQYQRAIELEFDHAAAYHGLTATFARMGDLESAHLVAATAIEILPDNSNIWARYGDTLHAIKSNRTAMAAYETAIKLNGKNQKAKQQLLMLQRLEQATAPDQRQAVKPLAPTHGARHGLP